MAKTTTFEFAGRKMELCMSVAVTMEIKNRFGGLEKMSERMSSGDSVDNLDDATWLLAAMASAGKAYVKLSEDRDVPTWTYEELKQLICLDDMNDLMAILSQAMVGSKETTVEVESKN